MALGPPGNPMNKPADKKSLKYIPEVCSLIRGNAHNRFMAYRMPEIAPVQSVGYVPGLYPRLRFTPPLPRFRPMHMKTNALHQ
jgi:hypothetical protein